MSARRLLTALAVIALVAWFWSRGESFLANNGPTFDEPVHLAAGYSYWTTGRFTLNCEHPPLLKLLWAVPLLFGERPPYPHDVAAATNDDHWHVGTAFLFNSDRAPHELLNPARRMNLVLGCAVVLLAGWWAFRIWNSKLAGVGAVAFAASDPNLLALSCVLTTDVGLTLFSLLACYLLWEYAAKPSRGLLIASGIALGLALGAKFSALALVAGLGAAGLVYVLRGGVLSLPSPLAGEGGGASPPGEGALRSPDHAEQTSGAEVHPSPGSQSLATLSHKGRGTETPRDRLALAFPFAFRLGLIALVTLAATYGFVHFDQWGRGLKFQLTRADHGDGMMYLNGELSRRGWYHYFLVLLPLKLPVGLLLALAVACVTGVLRRAPRVTFLLVPPLVFFALASYSRVDLGVRVVLPVLPFLFVTAAGLAGPVRAVCDRRERDCSEAPECLANRAFLLLCAAIAAVASAKQDPYPLAYFNEIAHGPQGGIRHVADSNLDWGQGLPQLKAYLAENGPDVIYLSYFGTDRPEAYGIRFQPLPTYGRVGEPGGELVPPDAERHVLVVSANNLLGIYLNDPNTFAWLRDRKPTAILGGCLYVYDLTGDADAIRRVRSLPAK